MIDPTRHRRGSQIGTLGTPNRLGSVPARHGSVLALLRSVHSRSLFLLAALLGSGCSDDGRSDQAISGSDGLSTTGTGASPETSAAGTSAAGVSEGSGGSAASSTTGDDAESSSDGSSGVQGTDGDSTGSEDDSSTGVAEGSSTGDSDDSSGVVDGVLDIGIIAHNDCTFTVEPASITVTEGTAFTVNWVSSPASEVEFDIAKIDPFNQVPIVIGMEPGGAYHDDIREWCGDLFTGTFEFRLTSCYDPLYIPVDCGG